MARARKKEKSDEVLVPLDRQTIEELMRLSQNTHFSPKQMVRWLTWLGRTTMGRTIIIKDGDKALELSLKEFDKLSKRLDIN